MRELPIGGKMTENNAVNMDRQMDRLLERVFKREKLYEASKKVVSNKGCMV
jgi:hypothetical protein